LCRYCYYRRNRRFDANADSYANADSNADSFADAHTGRVHGSGLGRLGHRFPNSVLQWPHGVHGAAGSELAILQPVSEYSDVPRQLRDANADSYACTYADANADSYACTYADANTDSYSDANADSYSRARARIRASLG